jgi:hypothetical protein
MKVKGLSFGVLALLVSISATLSAQGSPVEIQVVDDTGAAIGTGRMGIAALDRRVEIEHGIGRIPNVPNGTWMVSIRVIGFAPESVSVVVPMGARLRPVMMHRIPQPLSPVSVISSRDSVVLHDIEARMRVASGTLITADNLSVRNATYATDAVRIARGFTWKSPTRVVTRGTSRSGKGSARCESLPSADSIVSTLSVRTIPKVVVVYLNGTRLPGGLESINRMVPKDDILAIEAYPDVLSAPSLWRTNDACAVIGFWTKR